MRIRKLAATAVGGVITVAVMTFGATSASAYNQPDATAPANSVNSAAIIDGSVWQRDVAPAAWDALLANQKPGSIWQSHLAGPLQVWLRSGTVSGVEADGPYPGATKLQDHPGNGANSTEKVPADGKSHQVWVMCADGKVALGGGYRVGADQGDAVASKVQVTANEPTQVVKDGDTYKLEYKPIAGDAAGSILPNGWLVEAINTGTVDAIVRPWATCVKVS